MIRLLPLPPLLPPTSSTCPLGKVVPLSPLRPDFMFGVAFQLLLAGSQTCAQGNTAPAPMPPRLPPAVSTLPSSIRLELGPDAYFAIDPVTLQVPEDCARAAIVTMHADNIKTGIRETFFFIEILL